MGKKKECNHRMRMSFGFSCGSIMYDRETNISISYTDCEKCGGIYNPCWADDDHISRAIDIELYKKIRDVLVKQDKELAGKKLGYLLKSGVFYI